LIIVKVVVGAGSSWCLDLQGDLSCIR